MELSQLERRIARQHGSHGGGWWGLEEVDEEGLEAVKVVSDPELVLCLVSLAVVVVVIVVAVVVVEVILRLSRSSVRSSSEGSMVAVRMAEKGSMVQGMRVRRENQRRF